MPDKASLLVLPLEDVVPSAVLEAGAGQETAALEAAARRARHVRDAVRALRRGHGIRWAADITTLPLRFVVAVARAHGMTDAAGEEFGGWAVTGAGRRLDGGEVFRLPGRCGGCGYLETAPGHEVTCGREGSRALVPAPRGRSR